MVDNVARSLATPSMMTNGSLPPVSEVVPRTRTADTIAEKLGFDRDKPVRLRSGLLYTLNKLADAGHCYATRSQLLKTGEELLSVGEALLSETLDAMIRTEDVITEPIPETEKTTPELPLFFPALRGFPGPERKRRPPRGLRMPGRAARPSGGCF